MEFSDDLTYAEFIHRDSRFSATVSIGGAVTYVHVPNSGRLEELLLPGARVLLRPGTITKIPRKTPYTLAMVKNGVGYISIEAARANNLFEEALVQGAIPELAGYRIAFREKRIGMSRLDFVLEKDDTPWALVEVKSVTLVQDKTAKFPDAPTTRGRKHLKELIDRCLKGDRAVVMFVIQREDAERFSPCDETDPDFGRTLRQAHGIGVEILAYRCMVTPRVHYITASVPVIL